MTPQKKKTLDLDINPTQRLLYTSWLSYLLAQAPIYDAIPRIILENIMDTVVPALFFGVNFYHLLTSKNSVWLLQRNFGEKICQFARLSRIFFSLKLPYFGWNPSRIGSSRSPKYSRVLKFFLLFSLTCSQIGLIPLVHAHKCGCITKLKKKKTKKTRKPKKILSGASKRFQTTILWFATQCHKKRRNVSFAWGKWPRRVESPRRTIV
jgi:hypothetical protein